MMNPNERALALEPLMINEALINWRELREQLSNQILLDEK